MESLAKNLQIARGYMMQKVDDLSPEQLLEVPDGAANNVLWNLGHVVMSHYGMLYKPSGVELPVPQAWEDWFKPGTSPSDWTEQPPVDEVIAAARNQIPHIIENYSKGAFASFKPYDLVPGVTLSSPEDAMGFMLTHEGSHVGIVISLRRLLGAVHA